MKKMSKIIFILSACSMLYGCNEAEAPKAEITPPGVETIIVENIEVENITTYEDVTTSW